MKATDKLQIRWEGGETQVATWRDFVEANPDEAESVGADLDAHGRALLGGGAAPGVTIERLRTMQETGFRLLDDGTLDTVVRCNACGRVERFADVERDASGAIPPDAWEAIAAAHDCDGDA